MDKTKQMNWIVCLGEPPYMIGVVYEFDVVGLKYVQAGLWLSMGKAIKHHQNMALI